MQTINFNQTHHPHTSTLVIKPKQLFFKKTEVSKNLGKMQPETKKCVLIKKCVMKIVKRIPPPPLPEIKLYVNPHKLLDPPTIR